MGLLSNLFGKIGEAKMRLPVDDIESVIHRYGELLETSTTVIDDAARLPLSKDEMKSKLLYAIKLSSAGPQRDLVRNGYLMLANFQPLTVSQWDALQAYKRLSAENLDSSDVERVRAHMSAMLPIMEVIQPLIQKQTDEMQQLLSELKAAGA